MSATKEAANTMNHTTNDRWVNPEPSSVARAAACLRRHANQWLDVDTINAIAGTDWRVKHLRRQPFHLTIEQRSRPVELYGRQVEVLEYRCITRELTTEESAAADAEDVDCSV
jgi:hypothetical protein